MMDKRRLITTIITSYNHKRFVGEAIESALEQTGSFRHEILISDDGSDDGTHEIIEKYTNKFPHLITDISSPYNRGISANMKKSIACANGDYITFLEGDDKWIDNAKLADQLAFMSANKDCKMCFSECVFLYNESGQFKNPDNQNNLPLKIDGATIINHNNPVITFSSVFYEAIILKNIPDYLYDINLSEYVLCFYFENFGTIGHISKKQTAYRQHGSNTWATLSVIDRLSYMLQNRYMALMTCAPKSRNLLKIHIARLEAKLAEAQNTAK